MADNLNFSVTMESHKDEAQETIDAAVKKALTEMGLMAERFAKEEISRPKAHASGEVRPNVDTGLLRNSITYALGGKSAAIKQYKAQKGGGTGQYDGQAPADPKGERSVYIGTNVKYAPYVEAGTSRSRPYPFLRPAIENHSDTYKKIMESILEGLDIP